MDGEFPWLSPFLFGERISTVLSPSISYFLLLNFLLQPYLPAGSTEISGQCSLRGHCFCSVPDVAPYVIQLEVRKSSDGRDHVIACRWVANNSVLISGLDVLAAVAQEGEKEDGEDKKKKNTIRELKQCLHPPCLTMGSSTQDESFSSSGIKMGQAAIMLPFVWDSLNTTPSYQSHSGSF